MPSSGGPCLDVMMRIRADQMTALGQAARDEFVRRLVVHLRADFADQVGERSAEELESLVAQWIGRAERSGFSTEKHTEIFAELCLCHDSLTQDPLDVAIRRQLEDPSRPASVRIAALQEALLFGEGRRPG